MSPSDELEEMLIALTTQVASIHDLIRRPEYLATNYEDPKYQGFIVPRVDRMLNIADGWVMKLEHDLKRQQQQERERAEQRGWGGWGVSSLTPALESRSEFNQFLKGLEKVKMGVFFTVEGNVQIGRDMVTQGVRAFKGWV